MVDLNRMHERRSEVAFDRFVSKAKQCYGQETAILVNFSDYVELPLRHRAKLLEKTQKYLIREKPKIYGVYYSYGSSMNVDSVKAGFLGLV
jgi:hypothetical protein